MRTLPIPTPRVNSDRENPDRRKQKRRPGRPLVIVETRAAQAYLLAFILTVERDCHNLPRNEFATYLRRLLRGQSKASAARNLHADDGHGLDVVLADDLRRGTGF